MRILAFVGAVVLANVITIGGITLLVIAAPERQQHLAWLAVVALTLFVYGPLLLGAFVSYWDVRGSGDSRRYFRWWFLGLVASQLVAAIAIVVFTVLTGAAAWLPVLFIVGAALLHLLAWSVARGLYRRDEARRPAQPGWEPVTRRQILRKIVKVAVTFVVVLVLALIGLSLLEAVATGRERHPLTPVLFAFEFAFMGAAIACILVTLPLNRQLRENVSRDIGRLRKIGKLVLRGKPIELDADEQVAAAKYAVLISIVLPFTLGYIGLLYAGLGLQQLVQLQDGRTGGLAAVFLGLLVVLLVVLAPLYVMRIRRARAYAAAHRDLLPPSNEPPAPLPRSDDHRGFPASPATD